MPPETERQLARAIYKEMVEINSGFTTGATTPVVDAVAKRLEGRGLSGGRHLRRRRQSEEGEPGRALSRHRAPSSDSPARPHRRRRSEARGLEHGSVHAHREGRLLLRPRRGRRQGAGRGLDREPHSLQARRVQARPRHHRRADGRRRRRRPVQRRRVAAQEQARSDRRRAVPERRRLGRIGQRHPHRQRRSGEREVRHQLPARGAQQGRPQLAAGGRQRDLPSGRRAGPPIEVRVSAQDQRRHSRVFPRDVGNREGARRERSRRGGEGRRRPR